MKRALWILPALAVGVLALVLLVRRSKEPQASPPGEIARSVRTIAVPRLEVQPRAVGYGVVRPGRVWQAVAQVGGRIVERFERLEEGEFVSAETLLVRIDKADYELEVAQAEARMAALGAQIDELGARRATLGASLQLERRSLELAEAELARIQNLVADQTVAPADLEREERSVLAQRLRVQEIENGLQLLAPQKKVLEAQREQETSRLAKARLAVDRTVIRAPFDARIGPVQVEKGQVALAGQVLLSLDGIEASEVTAQVPLRGVRQLVAGGMEAIDPTQLSDETLRSFGLRATVRIRAQDTTFEWEGKVVRIPGIDAQTRTIGVDVEVSGPYEDLVPGKKPPLVRGMYVEVELLGRPRPDQVVVPRAALHDGVVYLVGPDDRLQRRRVEVAYVQTGLAAIASGLEGGETIVVSDLVPALEGMLLRPMADAEAAQALRADAAGETAVR